MRLFSIQDISCMDKPTWRYHQPFYKTLASVGYFTQDIQTKDFTEAFFDAIDHPLPKGVDPGYHLSLSPLYIREIIHVFSFYIEDEKELQLLMINVEFTGLFAVLWQILLHLCYHFKIKKISLMDRSFYGDPWTHYGFSGKLHDTKRILYL